VKTALTVMMMERDSEVTVLRTNNLNVSARQAFNVGAPRNNAPQ